MELQLPPGYYLELSADICVLRRDDTSAVAAFSARGVTKDVIEEAAWEDYRPPTLRQREIK